MEYAAAYGAELDSWESSSDSDSGPARRRSRRAVKRRRYGEDGPRTSSSSEEGGSGGHRRGAEGRAQRAERRRRRLERLDRRAQEVLEEAGGWGGATGRRKGRKAAGGGGAGPSGSVPGQLLSAYEHSLHRARPVTAYDWLLLTQRPFGAYVPQLGDFVAYIPQGHQQFVEWLGPSAGSYSGGTLRGGDGAGSWPWEAAEPSLRPVERFRVVTVEYRLDDLGPNTLVDLQLHPEPEQEDGPSAAAVAAPGGIAVTLPHPSDGQPDFLIDWAAFARARARRLRRGHRCKVFWSDHGEPGAGQWWEGTITGEGDVAPARWPGSPWDCFEVTYEAGGEPRRHSPWELFKLADRPEVAGAEDLNFAGADCPRLSPPAARRLAEAVETARHDERWALFRETPDPELSFESGGEAVNGRGRHIFYNACVPLPLGLDAVAARLANGYYRGAQAAQRDLELLAGNAEAFNGADSEVARLAASLCAALKRALQRPA